MLRTSNTTEFEFFTRYAMYIGSVENKIYTMYIVLILHFNILYITGITLALRRY